MNIRQGKNLNNKEIINENCVEARIENLVISQFNFDGNIKVELKLLSGSHKGTILTDKVNCLPNNSTTWKYLELRKSVGVPYSDDEDECLDIDLLLKGKHVGLNLSSYSYSTANVTFEGQKINYIRDFVPQIEDEIDNEPFRDLEEIDINQLFQEPTKEVLNKIRKV